MAVIQLTHDPILNSRAQVLVLPVNTAGILLDPVLARTKTLYVDNYQRYRSACREGSLQVGSCLLHKRQHERAGLAASHNGNQPLYIANLVVSDHPYHTPRTRWLTAAIIDLQQQLIPLIRYHGIRKMAVLTRPLIAPQALTETSHASVTDSVTDSALPLDWQHDILPLLTQYLQNLPKLRIELHLPKSIDI